MRAAGRAAFEGRDTKRTDAIARARSAPRLDKALEAQFKANQAAWEFLKAQPPGYQRMAIWFVISAKRDETRAKRLGRLIAMSAAKRRLTPMAPAVKNV